MTVKSTATWTCDRCKRVMECSLNTARVAPRNWIEVFFQPAKLVHSGRPTQTRAGHLCNECGGLLISFVNGTLEEDMAKEAKQAEMMKVVEAECRWSGADLLPRGSGRHTLFQTYRFMPDLDEPEDEDYEEDEEDDL